MWLLVEPRTVFDGMNSANKSAANDFARERTINRYNQQLNSLFDYWSQTLSQGGSELKALAIEDGTDAVFRISNATGFSWRAGA